MNPVHVQKGVLMANHKKVSKDEILNISEKIICSSKESSIEMRKIAKELGIAVGTLYNYYPSQEALITEVLKNSWNNTILKIHICLLDSECSFKNRLLSLLKIIELDINKRNYLGQKTMKLLFSVNKNISFNFFDEIKSKLSNEIKESINNLNINSSRKEILILRTDWLTSCILTSIITRNKCDKLNNEIIEFFLR